MFPPVVAVNLLLLPHLTALPELVRTLLTTLIVVPFVIWVSLPCVHLLRRRVAALLHRR